MQSIHDEATCRSAGSKLKPSMNNFEVKSGTWNHQKPTGCSWHHFGNVELWTSSSGNCNTGGYSGCFCLKAQGIEKY